MDQQAYPLTTCASNSVAVKPRSPSICRSESASLRLDTGSILSATDSERTISTVESSTLSEYFSVRSTNVGSSISLADSVSNTPSPYSEDIKSISELRASDIIVLFMGPTGSGKSHIIHTLAGQPDRCAGSHLEPCTTEIRAVRLFNHASYGDRLVLVDTPGSDHTSKFDLDILDIICMWLQKVRQRDIKIAGIVYLHRITANYVTESHHNLRTVCSKLYGDRAMRNVILVTTMWDKVHASASGKKKLETRAQDRENDLFKKHWKVMMDHRASTARFQNSSDSAWRIIDTVIKQHIWETRPVHYCAEEHMS